MITIKNLCKKYENVTPIKDISTTINKGDVIAIIGPSGTGKSTFLRCINLLETPTKGEIIIDNTDITKPGIDITAYRQKMGMVFQSFNLFANYSVIENIMIAPIEILHMPKQEAYDLAMNLLGTVGLKDKAFVYPDTLSGGQKQRVAIARAVAMKPEILLLDEPTSALDPTMVSEVMAVIRNLAKENMTMMIVTHEMNFAKNVANRVFYMDEGTIYEDGTPDEIFNHPKKEKTRLFVNNIHTLSFTINNKDEDYFELITKIEQFCKNMFISHDTSTHMQLLFEEIFTQKIIELKDISTFPIQFSFEYQSDSSILLTITYNGQNYNLIDNLNDISKKLIIGFTKDYAHNYDNGINKLIFKFN